MNAKQPQENPNPTQALRLPIPPPLPGETIVEYTKRTGMVTVKHDEAAAIDAQRMQDEITCLRQSLQEARELIDEFASAGVEHDARHYQVMQVPWAVIDAARKWLEEHGDERI